MKKKIVFEVDVTEDNFCADVFNGHVLFKCHEWDDGYCSLFRANASLTRCPECLRAEGLVNAVLQPNNRLGSNGFARRG